jgi:hypothetical protein
MNLFIPALVACIHLVALPHGVIDQIEDEQAVVELVNSAGEIEYRTVGIERFPCEIREGDEFHFACDGDFIQLRCGKREVQQ